MKIPVVNGMTEIYREGKFQISAQNKSDLKKDSIEISNEAKVFSKIDNFLNLGSSGRTDLSELNENEKEKFFEMLAKLIKKGIIGYEYLDVNGKKEKHFIVNRIGDERTYGAKRWKEKKIL